MTNVHLHVPSNNASKREGRHGLIRYELMEYIPTFGELGLILEVLVYGVRKDYEYGVCTWETRSCGNFSAILFSKSTDYSSSQKGRSQHTKYSVHAGTFDEVLKLQYSVQRTPPPPPCHGSFYTEYRTTEYIPLNFLYNPIA